MTALREFLDLVERNAAWLTRYPEYHAALDELDALVDESWLQLLEPDVVDVDTKGRL